MSPHIIVIILFQTDYCTILHNIAIIVDHRYYWDNSDYWDHSVETQELSSQTSFKCVAGYLAYNIALPMYADGLSCNIPVDGFTFVCSEKDIVRWLLGSEWGFQHFSDAGYDIGWHSG